MPTRDDYLEWLRSGGNRGRTVSRTGPGWRPQGSGGATVMPGGWDRYGVGTPEINRSMSMFDRGSGLHNAIARQSTQPRRFTYTGGDGQDYSMQTNQDDYARHMRGFSAADSARGTYDPTTGQITRGVMTMGDTGFRRSVGRSSVLENSNIDFDGISAYSSASPEQRAYLHSQGIRPRVITNIGGVTHDSWAEGGLGSEESTWSTVPMQDIMAKAREMGFQPSGPSGSWGLQAREFLTANGSLDAKTNQWAGTGTLAGAGGAGAGGAGGAGGGLGVGNSAQQQSAETDQAAVDQLRQRQAASGNSGLIGYQEARLRSMLEKGRRQSRLDSLLKEMQVAQMMGQVNAPKIYGFS